jgi:hypothetical protein
MRTLGGLTWPEGGYPAFFCVVTEKRPDATTSLENQKDYFEITVEFESHSLPVLFEKMKEVKRVEAFYASNSAKYYSYVREFSRWRREENSNLHIRSSQISSFEAGIIKIKELVSKKRLVFPENSTIKSQLRVFSKLSLKEELEFYGVSALTHVVAAFRKVSPGGQIQELKAKSWY